MTSDTISFTPHLQAADDYTNYWIRQVALRLRREICWCWHERGQMPPATEPSSLPPFTGRISSVLGMARFADEKKEFFCADPTARYLTDQIHALSLPDPDQYSGSFSWVISQLGLDDISSFALALALTSALDNAVGTVMACCMNDPLRNYPSFALIQNLWDEPAAVLSLSDPRHPLFAFGLLQCQKHPGPEMSHIDWDLPLSVPPLVARQLLFPSSILPVSLLPVIGSGIHTCGIEPAFKVHLPGLAAPERLTIIPVRGSKGCRRADVVKKAADASGTFVVKYTGDPVNLHNTAYFNSLLTLCWLRGYDLFLDYDTVSTFKANDNGGKNLSLLQSIPVTLFVGAAGRDLPPPFEGNILPAIEVPALTYNERIAYWEALLGKGTDLRPAIAECSRRYRFEAETITAIARALKAPGGTVTAKDLWDACRAEADIDLGDLATLVTPRFDNEELFLPPAQQRQFQEVETAMRALTEVHYGWGMAKTWNENGISVLFSGPPGSGKTMAAEVLAHKLDLPLFRIDLSQVVNKYIGETEKNLKKLFDAADIADMILFFDEADSLYGRRTEVKDAHDRYANLEISYLLERMERFKGLAILATNRKKDLDEAFLRRLRFVIEFPFPEVEERIRIWNQVLPRNVDTKEVDVNFLARQFPLAGGHIRSVVLNACLQSTGCKEGNRLTMESLIVGIKREYDKLHRPIDLEKFGPYVGIVRELG